MVQRDFQNLIKKGFTLIELLVVMAIIGVLIAIGVNAAQYNVAYSNDQAHKNYVVQVSQVLSEYFAEHNGYPYVLCPTFGSGWDNGGNLQTNVYNSIPTSDTVYQDFTSVMGKITTANLVSMIGYCSSTPPLGSSYSGAYILYLQTSTQQHCYDANGANYYIVGDGTYQNAGSYRDYYNIPADYGLTAINTSGYSSSCFRR